MTNEQEKDEFEAWALAKWPGASLTPYQNNCGIVVPERYKHPKLQAAWEAYQAGRAAMQSQVESEKHKPISVEELLEALEAMVDMVRMDGFGSYQALDIADEAIKKARGEL